ncbi:Protein F17H10.1 [Aphelenchoides avenae]|nr:Protein F17H10.1 [Aphelenchus avenae]
MLRLCYYLWPGPRVDDNSILFDPCEAVDMLNVGKELPKVIRCLEALDHLRLDECRHCIERLNDAGWVRLALQGSELCTLLKDRYEKHTAAQDEHDIDQLLSELQLDEQWAKALNWYSINICSEEDLSCEDLREPQPIVRKRSKTEKLVKLLQVLLFKSEYGTGATLVKENVLHVLYAVFQKYHESRKDISMIVLKVLSNIAEDSFYCAEAIARSEWLPLLADLINQPFHQEEAVLAHKVCINLLYSLGAERYKLPRDLYELHRPPPGIEPVLDVVFIHGMRGSAFRTWRQKDNPKAVQTTQFWPKVP